MKELKIQDEIFGPLLPYIEEDNITDINWNGSQLWLDDLKKGRYCNDGLQLDEKFINSFTNRIANLMSENFNKFRPLLEAETDGLRISILHEDVAKTGRSISIRKTPAKRRINRSSMLDTGYCTEELDNFMNNAIKAKCNVVIAGIPGVGKTEYLKTLTAYIPPTDRAITVEDNLEIRYKAINPGRDVVEIKVDDDFSYPNAIKTSLRQRPDWILMSEARSVEVKYLLESMSVGTNCITTIHTDDVHKIPQRIQNMMPAGENSEKTETDVYSFLNIGVVINRQIKEDSITRRIYQAAIFCINEDTGQKEIHLLYEDGKLLLDTLPSELERKFKAVGIKNPFEVEHES